MEQDLVVRGLSAHTRRSYLSTVMDLARYHHRAPDQLTDRDVQQYVRHLIEERRLAWGSCRVMVSGLRFFYEVTLGRERSEFSIPLPKGARKLPQILSREEVARLLNGVANLKHRVLLMTTYAAGLRVSEVTRLRVGDIDSQRMLIRVDQGKGRQDRYTLLSPRLLEELRRYCRVYRPTEWLFACRTNTAPLGISSAQHIYQAAKARAGIQKRGGIHTLRHGFATHLLESGVDVVTIQRLLGHDRIETTAHYLHVTPQRLSARVSPLDQLALAPLPPG
jgi:site-specific recombinase XerD